MEAVPETRDIVKGVEMENERIILGMKSNVAGLRKIWEQKEKQLDSKDGNSLYHLLKRLKTNESIIQILKSM